MCVCEREFGTKHSAVWGGAVRAGSSSAEPHECFGCACFSYLFAPPDLFAVDNAGNTCARRVHLLAQGALARSLRRPDSIGGLGGCAIHVALTVGIATLHSFARVASADEGAHTRGFVGGGRGVHALAYLAR